MIAVVTSAAANDQASSFKNVEPQMLEKALLPALLPHLKWEGGRADEKL